MDTNELIKALTADTPSKRGVSLPVVWWSAMGISVAIAAVVFLATLGVRPDIATAAETVRFLFKFVVTITLAVSAFGLVRALSRPGEGWRDAVAYLAATPLLLAAAVAVELFVLPPDTWSAKAIGSNSLICLTYIPLIGIGPLVVFTLYLEKRRADAASACRCCGGAAGRRDFRQLLRGAMHGRFSALRGHLVHHRRHRSHRSRCHNGSTICALVAAALRGGPRRQQLLCWQSSNADEAHSVGHCTPGGRT